MGEVAIYGDHDMRVEGWGGRYQAALTLAHFEVLEGHLGAGVADEHLAVEREGDVALGQVDHAAHHVARLPRPPERLAAHVPALRLRGRGAPTSALPGRREGATGGDRGARRGDRGR